MYVRYPLTRLAVAAAAGALAAAAAVVPAVAADGRSGAPGPAPVSGSDSGKAAPGASSTPTAPGTGAAVPGKGTAAASTPGAAATPQSPAASAQAVAPADPAAAGTRFYPGRVNARGGLALRSRPDRGSQVLRVARQGEIVWIYCKTPGQNVQGNNLWYLLADGTWAWGAARFIDNMGPAPRWC